MSGKPQPHLDVGRVVVKKRDNKLTAVLLLLYFFNLGCSSMKFEDVGALVFIFARFQTLGDISNALLFVVQKG